MQAEGESPAKGKGPAEGEEHMQEACSSEHPRVLGYSAYVNENLDETARLHEVQVETRVLPIVLC